MDSQFSVLPNLTDLMPNKLFYKELINSDGLTEDDCNDMDESLDLNDLEEVFSDHILLGKRLQKSLYRGNLEDLDENTSHPPIELTGLALKLFTKAVPNYGLDQLDMDYVSSVSESTKVSPCAMILALIYLERLQLKNTDYLDSVSPSGLFVVTMLVASKFLFENEDDIVTNQIWSEALNMDVKELNILEQKFLAAIDWQLYVGSTDFFNHLSDIEKMIASKQSSTRGWLTYSDICSILQDALIRKSILITLERILKVFAVSAFSYAVTVLSIYTAGCAINNCRCNQKLVSFNGTSQMKSDVQRSLPELPSNEPERLSQLVTEDTFHLKSTFNNLNNIESSEFQDMSLTVNSELELLNFKRSVALFFGNFFSSKKADYENISNSLQNSVLDSMVTHKAYSLEWWRFGFNNACIPVSIS